VDKACRLEAYLHALAARRRSLKAEGDKIDTRFTGLMNNLQASLFTDEDLTVIAADEFESDDGSHIIIPQDNDNADLVENFSEDSVLLKPHALVRQPTPPMEGGLSCSMGSVLQAMSATLGGDDESLAHSACPPLRADIRGNHSDNLAQMQQKAHTQARMSPPRTRELSAEAEAWRERYYQEGRNHGINFRTGMSGHQGLVSYMVHPHAYLDGQKRSLPKMSSHSGLSRSNTGRSTSQSGYNSATPSYSYSYSRDSQM